MARGEILLSEGDPPVFEVVNEAARAPMLIIGDHAGRAVPKNLTGFDLPAHAFERHVAYDLGIAPLARALAHRLDAPAVLHGYSRLLIDPNRPLDDPTSICVISDGLIVDGNRNLTTVQRERRASELFRPYHREIGRRLSDMALGGCPPALISLHSFTPRLRNGGLRPWHVGVLWGDDARIPVPLMHALGADGDVCVGDNQPYSGANGHGYTVEHHARGHGLPHVLIEVRQDLISDEAGVEHWADRLAGALSPILATVLL